VVHFQVQLGVTFWSALWQFSILAITRWYMFQLFAL